jgi:hypothetical protein
LELDLCITEKKNNFFEVRINKKYTVGPSAQSPSNLAPWSCVKGRWCQCPEKVSFLLQKEITSN